MIDRRPVTSALLLMLVEASGKPVGLGEPPSGIDDSEPWGILHSIPGGGYEGSLNDPNSDIAFVYQVDSIGRSIGQVEWMADLIRRTMLARTASGSFQVAFPVLEGSIVNDRRPDTTPGGVIAEGEVSTNTRVYTISERFSVHVTPS